MEREGGREGGGVCGEGRVWVYNSKFEIYQQQDASHSEPLVTSHGCASPSGSSTSTSMFCAFLVAYHMPSDALRLLS